MAYLVLLSLFQKKKKKKKNCEIYDSANGSLNKRVEKKYLNQSVLLLLWWHIKLSSHYGWDPEAIKL